MKDQVMFVLDEFLGPVNGTEAQFWLLFNALRAREGCPRVATLKFSQYLTDRLPADRYECLAIDSLFTLRAWRKAFVFALQARARGVKVSHLYLNDVSILLPAFFWLAGIKTIVSRRDLGFWYSKSVLRVLRINRWFVSTVIGNCAAVKSAVMSAEYYPPRKVRVILNGVDPPARIEATDFRARCAVPQTALVLGMVCNLRKLKRVEDAIETVARLAKRGLTPHLMIAGEDRIEEGISQRAALLALATRLKVSGQVHFRRA